MNYRNITRVPISHARRYQVLNTGVVLLPNVQEDFIQPELRVLGQTRELKHNKLNCYTLYMPPLESHFTNMLHHVTSYNIM